MIEFMSKNFALVSATVTLIAVSMAVAFLFGYLAVFDWNLIWFIEYTDIIKLGLVGWAIFSTFGWLVVQIVEYAHRSVFRNNTARFLIFYAVITMIAFGAALYGDLTTIQPFNIELHFLLFFLSLVFIRFALYFNLMYRANSFDLWRMGTELGLLILFIGLLGQAVGLKTLITPVAKHEVVIREDDKSRRALVASKIIIITSHFTILEISASVVVIPSSDVLQITYHP